MVRRASPTNLPSRQYWLAIFAFLPWWEARVADSLLYRYQCSKASLVFGGLHPQQWGHGRHSRKSQMSEWTAPDSRWDLGLLSSGLLNLSLTFHQQRYQHWHPQLKFITCEFYGVKNITIGQLQIRHLKLQIQRRRDSNFIRFRKLSTAPPRCPNQGPFWARTLSSQLKMLS